MRRTSGWWMSEKAQHWNSRGHFFAAAAEAMRRILVDHARDKSHRETRRRLGTGDTRCNRCPWRDRPAELIGLQRRSRPTCRTRPSSGRDWPNCDIFAGLTVPEDAPKSWTSRRRTVDRQWAYARAWLRTQLSAE